MHEEMPWLPSVGFQLLLPIGANGDPPGQEGSATVLADWLFRGAGERDSRELSNALDALGVRRGGGAGSEYLTLSGALLRESFAEAIALFRDIARRPSLHDSEFEPARKLALQELAAVDDEPTQVLLLRLNERFFASTHGRSPYGTREGLTAVTADSVRHDYRQRASRAGPVLALAGGIDWQSVKDSVEQLFADWQSRETQAAPVELRPPHRHHVRRDSAQTLIGIAYPAAAPGDSDWYPHALAAGVLSGSMGSRLFREVREKRGLAYHVAAVTRALKGFGYTVAFAGTTPERAGETLEVVLTELSKLSHGVAEDELERARTGLLSQLVMQGESTGSRAAALTRDSYLLGRPRSLAEVRQAVEQVSLSEVNRYLESRADPPFTVLTLGPEPHVQQ